MNIFIFLKNIFCKYNIILMVKKNNNYLVIFITIIIIITIFLFKKLICYKKKKYLSIYELKKFIDSWANDVTSGKFRGEYIANKYFAKNAILRGTVSSISRTQNNGIMNSWSRSSNNDNFTNENISKYFDFFNGNNLKYLTTISPQTLKNEFFDLEDYKNYQIIRIDDYIIQFLIYKEFAYKDSYNNTFQYVIAEMSFTIKKEDNNEIKIYVLQSKPQFKCPPPELNESSIKAGTLKTRNPRFNIC